MKRTRFVIFGALACGAVVSASAQSININAVISGEVVPGVYGQVVLGNGPPPPVVYAQPVLVQRAPVVVGVAPVEPIYLHVPPGHAKHWSRHCQEYHACNRPVYFVKSAEYEPNYHGHEGHGHEGHGHEGHGHHGD